MARTHGAARVAVAIATESARDTWLRVASAAACFAAIMGFSRLSYGVLVPAMRRDLGSTYAAYGVIGGANFVGYLAGTLAVTWLGRRSDRSRTNALALAAMCLAMGASGFVRGTVELGVLRFLVGLASGIALALTLALAVERVPPERRGLAAAIVWAGGSLGIAIVGLGALLEPLALPNVWRYQWFAMALAGIAFTIAYATRTSGTFAASERVDDGAPIGIGARAKYLPLSFGYFCFGFGYIAILTFFGAALANARAFPSSAAWLILGVAGSVGAVVWGPLVDRYRSGVPVAFACACCALGAVLVASRITACAAAGALLIGVSFIGVPAMIGALIQQRESPDRYPRAFASMTVVLGVGQILGPIAAGIAADRIDTSAALLLGAGALVLAVLGASRYRVKAVATG